MIIYKAAGILIRDKKLLVEKSFKKAFYLAPGGAIKAGETAKQALIRELKEEFNIAVIEDDLKDFGHYYAQAAGQEGKTVDMATFLVTKWYGEPTPHSEVEKLAWISSSIPNGMLLGSIFQHEVIPALKARDLID